MALVKKLTKIGNSWGIILPTDVLKLVGLEPGCECEIEVNDDRIIIQAALSEHDRKVMKSFAKVVRKYRVALEKLAKSDSAAGGLPG